MRVSASQIKNALLCQRKWYFSSIAKLPQAPSPSAQLGSLVHGYLEEYVKSNGVRAWPIPDPHRVAEIMAPALPGLPTGPGILVETSFSLSRSSALYTGRIDLEYPDPDDPSTWHVDDHKTTSNIRYALDEEGLRADPQASIYAAQAFALRPWIDRVALTWRYYSTRAPYRRQLTTATVLPEEAEYQMEGLDLFVEKRMLPIFEKGVQENGNEIPHNPNACRAFGGCPYRAFCDLPINERLNPTEGMDPQMNIIERLREQKRLADASAVVAINPPEQRAPTEADKGNVEAAAKIDVRIMPDSEIESVMQDVSIPLPACDQADGAPEVTYGAHEIPPETQVKKSRAKKAAQILAGLDSPLSSPDSPPCAKEAKPGVRMLLINCIAVGNLRANRSIFEDVHSALKAQGVEDFALVDYGKGSAFFRDALIKILATMTDGAICVDSSSREFSISASALSNWADVVVRGV